jgi:hypothetical protein
MDKLKTLSVFLAAIFGSLIFIAPAAHADFDGKMNFAEYLWIDWKIPTSNTQAEVEDNCSCSGVLTDTFDHNGNPAKLVKYRNTDDSVVKVWYVKRDDGRWHVYDKAWCDGTGCLGPARKT